MNCHLFDGEEAEFIYDNIPVWRVMLSKRIFLKVCLTAIPVGLIPAASADTTQLILQGKVVMQDGSVPPKSVGIERVCSDNASAPGPLTDKKGEYLWRMEVDNMRQRVCKLRAVLAGYISSEIDISAFNSYTNPKLPELVLTPGVADPNAINASNENVPPRSLTAWKAAIKAIQAANMAEAIAQLQEVVKASPKFAQGWNTLGLVYQQQDKSPEARDAFQHAIESDPKFLPSYITLDRLCINFKDWDCAAKTSDQLIKADTKKLYPEAYLHQAAARLQVKDLTGAEASARQALAAHANPRTEYVLGRILEAKGDLSGAREHMSKFIEIMPSAPDIEQIRTHLQNLGTPDAGKGGEPNLELP
jgi:tetratricopeptide (TPR) repeat protein